MCKLTVAKPVRAPCEPPEFTIGTLRKAIPAHCFERSALRSYGYVAVDMILIALMYKATTYFSAAPWPVEALILWPLYWFFQGAVATGVWVIAHECGHQAFSSSRLINDVTGFVLHSALLVPYFSWKHSHRRHHSNVRRMLVHQSTHTYNRHTHRLAPWTRTRCLFPRRLATNQAACAGCSKSTSTCLCCASSWWPCDR